VLITANGNVKVGNAISDVTDLGTVTVVGNRYVGPNVTLPDFTSNVIVSGNILGNVGNVTSNVGNVGSNLVTVGNTVTVIDTPNNQSNVSTPITTTIGGSNITPLKFASGGLNPGYIAPTPFYQTTNDAQSKFYYGSRPYQTGGPTGQVFDPVLYNTAPEAPKIPFGSQAVNQPLTSAQIAAIVANPSSNNSQQNTQQASTFVPAPVAPVQQPMSQPAPVIQPAPVAPVQQPVVQPPQSVFEKGPAYEGKDFGPSDLYGTPQPVPTPIAPEFTAPVQQPARDPMYAGMPDVMYNNMMEHYQRRQASAEQQGLPPGVYIDQPVERPWNRWMDDQRDLTNLANFGNYPVQAGQPVQPVAPMTTPGLPSWMPPDTTTTVMPNGTTGYNINGMIYDQTGSIISSGVGPVAP